jgi:hypothetical protein
LNNSLVPIIAGAVVGFLVGLTGMGGGALTTPFLILVMKLDPVIAVGTDLVFAAMTKIVGGVQHHREKNVTFAPVLWMAAGSLPTAWLGARLVLTYWETSSFTSKFLTEFLGGVLALVGVIVLARVVRLIGPKTYLEVRWPGPWALLAVGAVGGFLVGTTSVGGGTVIMALLLVFFSIPLNHMVGLDIVHGAVLTTVPAITYALAGRTDWPLVAWMLIGSIPGAWLGARSVNRIPRRLIRGILGAVILLVGIHLLLSRGS